MAFWLLGSPSQDLQIFLVGDRTEFLSCPPSCASSRFAYLRLFFSALCLYFIPILASRTRTDSKLCLWRESGAPMLPLRARLCSDWTSNSGAAVQSFVRNFVLVSWKRDLCVFLSRCVQVCFKLTAAAFRLTLKCREMKPIFSAAD